MPTHKQLLKRSRANRNALGAQFDAIGRIALVNVLTGRISHSEATKCLERLRELWLDEGGDLTNKAKIKLWLARHKMLKGVNLEWVSE